MSGPQFSIVIATYDRAGLVRQCLDSVLSQRLTDYEIIVVDDGSRDATADVVRSYGDRVVLHRQENRGPGAARNAGALCASGRYLVFLDSDDVFFPWTLATYASVIASSGEPSFIAGKPRIFTDASVLADVRDTPVQAESFPDFLASADEWRWYGASSLVVRADVFRAVGAFTDRRINGEDADLTMRLGVQPGFVRVASPLCFGYREHAGSAVADSTRTLEGARHAVRMEQSGQYPGGAARARERRIMLTRHFRPVMLTCVAERRFAAAWSLYLSTWRWHLALGRLRFLIGFPVHALVAAVKPATDQRAG